MRPYNLQCIAIPLLTLVCQNSVAQPNGISIIDHIPFEIQCSSFVEKPGPEKQIILVSSEADFWLGQRGFSHANIVFEFDSMLPWHQWQDIDYQLAAGKASHPWQPMPSLKFPRAGAVFLGHYSIAVGEQVFIRFRNKKTGNLLEQHLVYRPVLMPAFVGSRQHAGTHTTKEHDISTTIQEHPKAADSTGWLNGNTLLVQPDVSVDLLFDRQAISRDSTLEFSCYDFSDTCTPVWQPTGHVLHLEAIKGNASFMLRLRYNGMTSQLNILIAAKPYWYQLPIARYILLIVSLLILLGGPLLAYRFYSKKEKSKRRLAERQLQLMHNQLNPHFVFNALSSIASIIQMGNKEKASEYLTVFAGMMRHTMEVADLSMISLSKELAQMEQYLRIEQMRFGFRFCISVARTLNLNWIELPPQILQPTIENAVKHGASGLGSEGVVSLRVYAEGHDLYISVRNNAKSLPSKKLHQGFGYGLRFTEDLITQLRQLNQPFQVEYRLKHTEQRTEAIFFFQNWLETV